MGTAEKSGSGVADTANLTCAFSVLAFMAYGGIGPILSSHVNMCFPAKYGTVMGIISTAANVAAARYGPPSKQHLVLEDLPSPFLHALVGCLLSLPLVYCSLARLMTKARE